jgi:hypothetical protein
LSPTQAREESRSLLFSCEREPPRRKAVASGFVLCRTGVAFQRENSTGQARGIFDHLMQEELSGLIDALVKQRYISIKDEDVTYHLPDAL